MHGREPAASGQAEGSPTPLRGEAIAGDFTTYYSNDMRDLKYPSFDLQATVKNLEMQ